MKGIGGGDFVVKKNAKSGKTYAKVIGGVSTGTGRGKALSNHKNSNHLTYDNSFGRVGGGAYRSGKLRSTKLFSESGKRAFGTKTGAGFAGRPNTGLALIESFHRYKQYKALMKYKKHGRYGDYSGRGLYYPRHYHHCYGGCYGGSYCDFGICRCYEGSFAIHGSCWNSWNDYATTKQADSNSFVKYDPFLSCSSNQTCQEIGMNLICSDKSEKCECREDMKWNSDDLECQIYIDVDCSIFGENTDPKSLMSGEEKGQVSSEGKTAEEVQLKEDLNPSWDDCVDDEAGGIKAGLCMDSIIQSTVFPNSTIHTCKIEGVKELIEGVKVENGTKVDNTCHLPTYPYSYNLDTFESNDCTNYDYIKFCPKTCNKCKEKWSGEYGGLDVEGIILPSYNVTEDDNGDLSFNITEITPNQTLSTSYLIDLDLNQTQPMDVKKYFCIEINAISVKYSEPDRIASFKRQVNCKLHQFSY